MPSTAEVRDLLIGCCLAGYVSGIFAVYVRIHLSYMFGRGR